MAKKGQPEDEMKYDDLRPIGDLMARSLSRPARIAIAMPCVAAGLLLGCNLDHCPEDYRLVGDRCVLELDGGDLADGSVDAELDGEARACESCSEATPFCDDADRCVACLDDEHCDEGRCAAGACVACLEDAECGPSAPACREHACVSCAGRDDCGDELVLREARARLCACEVQIEARERMRSSEARGPFIESRQAHYCHARSIEDAPTLETLRLRELIEDWHGQFDLEAIDCARPGYGSFVVPAVSPDGECTTDAQCIGGRCQDCVCVSSDGIDCNWSDSCGTTRSGLACRPDSQTCGEPPTMGEACIDRCAEGSVCRAELCRGPGDVGDACTPKAAGQCAEGLFCDDESAECKPRVSEGQECKRDDYCVSGLHCRDRTCLALVAEGEACTEGEECAPGLRCGSGACRPIRLFGEACDAEAPCAHGLGCIDGTCQSLPVVGEACGDAGCLRGTCKDGRCRDLPAGAECVHSATDFKAGWGEALDECGVSATCMTQGSETTPRCRRVATEGESCQTSLCDVGLSCEDGECAALGSYFNFSCG